MLVIAAGLTLLVSPAHAEINKLVLDGAIELLKAGRADDVYVMLEPLEVEAAGDLVYDYLLATAALGSNRPSKATFVYERILAVAPNYVQVRADMGRAYFALGDYGRAKIEFEAVLAIQNLPPDLRGTVEQYAKAAEANDQNKATLLTGYLELGFGNDSNIKSINKSETIAYPGNPSIPVPAGTYSNQGSKIDNYTTLGLGGELSHRLSAQWGVYAGADYRGRAYQHFCENTCYASLDGRSGLSYTNGAWLLRAGMTSGVFTLNDVAFRDSLGVSLDWKLVMASSSQLSLGFSSNRASYLSIGTVSENTQTNSLSAGWLSSIGDGSGVFSISVSGGTELALRGRSDGNKEFYGPRFLFQKSFNPQWGGYITTGSAYSKYSGTNILYGVSREESFTDFALGATWTLRKGVSVRPQVSYIRNSSNADLYAYDKTDVSVNLRLDY